MIGLNDFRRQYREQAVMIDKYCWRFYDSERYDRPVLVMVPGAFCAGEIFWNQITALGDRVRVVSVTLPPIESIAGLADGIATLMTELDIPSANVLGSSLGGYLVQVLAARHPHRLRTIYIANSLLHAHGLQQPGDPIKMRAATASRLRSATLEMINNWPESEPGHVMLKKLLMDHNERCLTDTMIKLRTVVLHSLPLAPHIDIPLGRVVVIDCDDDPMISEQGRAQVRDRFAGAEIQSLHTGGHFPYILRAEVYTPIIERRLI